MISTPKAQFTCSIAYSQHKHGGDNSIVQTNLLDNEIINQDITQTNLGQNRELQF